MWWEDECHRRETRVEEVRDSAYSPLLPFSIHWPPSSSALPGVSIRAVFRNRSEIHLFDPCHPLPTFLPPVRSLNESQRVASSTSNSDNTQQITFTAYIERNCLRSPPLSPQS